MSGKCLSITALFLLILGCLIGVCVILLQEDSLEDGSVGVEEKSFKDLEPEVRTRILSFPPNYLSEM